MQAEQAKLGSLNERRNATFLFDLELPKRTVGRYSKLSIIRPGCSRLLKFEKKDSTGCLIETLFKYPDQVV